MKWGLENESGKGKSGIRGNSFKCGGRISERMQIEMPLNAVKECGFDTTRYDLVTDTGSKLPQVFAKCAVHQTVSNHRFSDVSQAFRYFRCDQENQSFLFLEKNNQLSPFVGDMTELAYRIASAYEDNQYGADYAYQIFEINVVHGTVILSPVTVNVLGRTNDRENDYSYIKLQACNATGDELTTISIRVDERA